MQEFLKTENVDILYTSNSNQTSNADIGRQHNAINESMEDKMPRTIMFYNNTIHSKTDINRIDVVNAKIHEDICIENRDLIKYRKVNAEKINDDHIQTIRTGHKYYKNHVIPWTHVRPKKK